MLSFLTKQKQNITNASNFTISSKTKTNYVTAHQVVETSNESTTSIFLKSHCNIRFNYNRFSGSTATTTTVRLRSHSTKNWFVKSGACALLFMFCFLIFISFTCQTRSFSWYLTWKGLSSSLYQDGSKCNWRRKRDCFSSVSPDDV